MILKVETQSEYINALAAIELHLQKEAANMSEAELAELQRLSLVVERFEDASYPMPVVPT